MDHIFIKVYHLTCFLQYVGPLSAVVFGCYCMLNSLPPKYDIKAV